MSVFSVYSLFHVVRLKTVKLQMSSLTLTLSSSSSSSFCFPSPNLGHGNNHHGDSIQLQVRGLLFGHCGGTRTASQSVHSGFSKTRCCRGCSRQQPSHSFWGLKDTARGLQSEFYAQPFDDKLLPPPRGQTRPGGLGGLGAGEVRLRFDKIAA